ncbi:10131_t:CDS:2 [Cetraspora pellucida]|uniref:10131_t:CDS:1 n=1 Tax=Cetraspora pellucida TaxID=1433469 RepID=A0A9N8ZL44_9GLOM|nr:10131_t:CDS:2 [Cetraspora pellucida]
MLDYLIHDVDLKIQLNSEFTEQSILQRTEIQVDKQFNSLLEKVIDELTWPITGKITDDFFDIINIQFSKNTTLKGLYKKLKQADYFNEFSEEQPSTNNFYVADDDLFLKFNKVKIFHDTIILQLLTPILQKVRPKITLSSFNS